jgi:hypothetical protein
MIITMRMGTGMVIVKDMTGAETELTLNKHTIQNHQSHQAIVLVQINYEIFADK